VTCCLSLLRTAIYLKAGALLFPTLKAWALIRSPKAPRAEGAEPIMTALMTSFIMNQAESMAIANQSSILKLFP
jgi:hypothetical protein